VTGWSRGAAAIAAMKTAWGKTIALTFLVSLLWTAQAVAQPQWRLDAIANSTVAPGGTVPYVVQATNVGDQPTDGSDVTMTATLPAGMTAQDASVRIPNGDQFITFACTAGDGSSPVAGATTVSCSNSQVLDGFGANGTNWEELDLTVVVDPAASGTLTASFGVSGGGAPADATTVYPVRVTNDPPAFGLSAFDAQFVDLSGNPVTQAGGHPDGGSFSFDFNLGTDPLKGPVWPVEPVKDLAVNLPPGLLGNPTVVDQCTASELANTQGVQSQPLCPSSSQVGIAVIRNNTGGHPNSTFTAPIPVYNMVPPPNAPARLGFNVLGSLVTLDAHLRTGGDYGVTVTAHDIPEGITLLGTSLTLWGVPASSSHDAQRACPGQNPPGVGGPACATNTVQKAFLRLPTSCTAPVGLPFSATVDSWFDPGTFVTADWATHLLPGYPFAESDWGIPAGTANCGGVPFDPAFSATPTTPQAASPSGFQFDLRLPQSDDPSVVGESDLRSAVVTLPAGVRVSPSSAKGLAACAPSQIRLNDASAPDCPDASKIGSVTIATPLLRQPLNGGVFLAKQNDNPFGTLLALYIVAEGSGVVVKLPGKIAADPSTGQLTTTVDNNPQTPFSDLQLTFDGGPLAPLALPPACGTYFTHTDLTGWNGRTVSADTPFTVTSGCGPARFSPHFSAGTTHPIAGATSSFDVALSRTDADQEIGGLTIDMPTGLTAKIANATLCSEGHAAGGSCPEASKIGDVTVGAGAGPDPFYITNGRAYLTGPYHGAPFGLSIVVPAVAGPFNLGDVVVRAAIFIDKHSAAVRIVSDPLPTILQGIPLQVRDVRVSANRPDFFLNPTSCAEKTITGVIHSVAGALAHVSSPFQALECAHLGFKPRMVLTVGGKGHTRRGKSTPLTTRVTMPRGNANLRFVRVSLPTTINARLTVINDACTRAEFETDIGKCEHARAGSAVAVTPLLRDPLRGSVYFVKNGHPIPDLFVALRGQVDFDLIGRVSIPGGVHLATTFDAAPDVPIKSFTLRLLGDPAHGSVGAARNLCSASSRRHKAALDYIAQNGKVRQIEQALVVKGCRRSHPARKTHRRSRRRG
jgi:uncharacterized repeat protein (TIGR01451 family)